MPVVSQRHRDSRRRQILEASRRCFAQRGFHATSMHGICAEAGLSASTVYGYFDGKDDLVVAIIEEVLAEITSALDTITHPDPPPPLHEILGAVLRALDPAPHDGDLARLAVQVWAEATRSPELNTRLAGYCLGIRERFTAVVESHQRDGTVDPTIDAQDIACALTAAGSAFLAQRALFDDLRAETFTAGLRTLITGQEQGLTSAKNADPSPPGPPDLAATG